MLSILNDIADLTIFFILFIGTVKDYTLKFNTIIEDSYKKNISLHYQYIVLFMILFCTVYKLVNYRTKHLGVLFKSFVSMITLIFGVVVNFSFKLLKDRCDDIHQSNTIGLESVIVYIQSMVMIKVFIRYIYFINWKVYRFF